MRLFSLLLALCLATGARAAIKDGATTRIVSLVPNVTEILFDIGAGDQVVAVSDFCRYPPAAMQKPKVGGLLNPALEKVLIQKPDIVILQSAQSDLQHKLEIAHISTLVVHSDSIEDVLGSIREVGLLTGRTTEARTLAERISAKLEDLRRRYAGAPHKRVLLIVGRQPASLQNIFAAGSKTYLGELITAAGGDNVAPASSTPYVPLTKEQLISLDPDILIDSSLGEAGSNPAVVQAHKKAWQQLPTLKAAKTGHIYYLEDPHLMVPGPGMPATADKLAQLLHEKGPSQ